MASLVFVADANPATAESPCSLRIDSIVAAGAAAAADRRSSFEEPHANFESKIHAGERSHRAHVDDVSGICIVQRTVLKDANFRMVPAAEHLDFIRVRHVPCEANTACAEDAPFL